MNRPIEQVLGMSEAKPRRGRPKGSGIDDRARLASIAALLVAEPGLKPTTAIKRIGVSDPSVIRRLRDKFHAARAELMAELRASSQPAAAKAPRPRAAHDVETRVESASPSISPKVQPPTAAVCASVEEPKCVMQSEPIEAAPAHKPAAATGARVPSQRKAEPPRHELEAWLSTMCGLSFQAASQAFETQLTLLAQFVRLPQVAMMMRQQVALNDYALAISDCGRRSRHH